MQIDTQVGRKMDERQMGGGKWTGVPPYLGNGIKGWVGEG